MTLTDKQLMIVADMLTKETIKQARAQVDRDPNLAVFIVRDYSELVEWGLDDLAWAMYRETCSRNEVNWFLDELEKKLEEKE